MSTFNRLIPASNDERAEICLDDYIYIEHCPVIIYCSCFSSIKKILIRQLISLINQFVVIIVMNSYIRIRYCSVCYNTVVCTHPACRVYLSSHYTLPDMSLCLPIWDPTPGGHTCVSCDTPQLRHQS